MLMKNILILKSFMLVLDTAVTFVNNIQNQVALDVDISEKIKPHSWQKTLGVGLLSVPSLGLTILGAFLKTTNFLLLRLLL